MSWAGNGALLGESLENEGHSFGRHVSEVRRLAQRKEEPADEVDGLPARDLMSQATALSALTQFSARFFVSKRIACSLLHFLSLEVKSSLESFPTGPHN